MLGLIAAPTASPSSRGPGRGPFKAKTRVRIPSGTPHPENRESPARIPRVVSGMRTSKTPDRRCVHAASRPRGLPAAFRAPAALRPRCAVAVRASHRASPADRAAVAHQPSQDARDARERPDGPSAHHVAPDGFSGPQARPGCRSARGRQVGESGQLLIEVGKLSRSRLAVVGGRPRPEHYPSPERSPAPPPPG